MRGGERSSADPPEDDLGRRHLNESQRAPWRASQRVALRLRARAQCVLQCDGDVSPTGRYILDVQKLTVLH